VTTGPAKVLLRNVVADDEAVRIRADTRDPVAAFRNLSAAIAGRLARSADGAG